MTEEEKKKMFIKLYPIGYNATLLGAKPIGYYIRTFNAKASDGYEYAWKTFYERVHPSFGGNHEKFLSPLLIKQAEEQGYFPAHRLVAQMVGVNPKLGIPLNADGLYADDVAVLCMRRIQLEEPRLDSFRQCTEDELPALLHGKQFESQTIANMSIKPEGQRIADVSRFMEGQTELEKYGEEWSKDPVEYAKQVSEANRIRQSIAPDDYMTNGQYNGCDKQHWANIMESMEANLAKADDVEGKVEQYRQRLLNE